jgi:hypothetical protein
MFYTFMPAKCFCTFFLLTQTVEPMKTPVWILLLIFTLQSLPEAQSQMMPVKRKALIELVSNTRCGVCAFRVPRMKANIQPYQSDFHLLSLYAPFPYSNCPFHTSYPSLYNTRIAYYNPVGTPTVYVNGQRVSQGDSILTRAYMEERSQDLSFLDIRLERKSETEVEVHLTNLGFPVADSTYVLAVWMVQTEAIGGPLSSYQYHQNVAREALTDINGLEITLPSAGQSSSHTFELRDVVLINDGEIAALAFVQEKNSKHVLNSAFLSLEESSSIRNVTTIELGISPNPASDWIQILRTPVQGARMRILDMQGRLCLETMHTGDPVNISQLTAGTYTVLLEEGLSSGQSTLIITR